MDTGTARLDSADIARRVIGAAPRSTDPASTRAPPPRPDGRRTSTAGARTNVRPQKQAGYRQRRGHRAARRSERRAVPGARRAGAAPTATASVRVTAVQDLVFRWVRRAQPARPLRAARGRRPRPARRRHHRRRHQLPGRRVVQARGDAVARPRPGARAAPARHARAHRPGAELDIKISGCPNGCGQHHIATLGFQGSLRKVDGRAVPQYFVHGRRRHRRRPAPPSAGSPPKCRRAARPRRSSGWCGSTPTTRQEGESPVAFFRTLEVPKVKALLADLELLTPATRHRDRLHRPGRDHGVPAGDDRGRVRGLIPATAAGG